MSLRDHAFGYEGWALLEYRGAQFVGGIISVKEMYGEQWLEVKVPMQMGGDEGDEFVTKYVPVREVTCIVKATEANVRRVVECIHAAQKGQVPSRPGEMVN